MGKKNRQVIPQKMPTREHMVPVAGCGCGDGDADADGAKTRRCGCRGIPPRGSRKRNGSKVYAG